MALARFMANPIGRVARIMGGLFLVALGVFTVLGVIAAVLIAIGIVMLLAGAVNFCLISPFSAPHFSGPTHCIVPNDTIPQSIYPSRRAKTGPIAARGYDVSTRARGWLVVSLQMALTAGLGHTA